MIIIKERDNYFDNAKGVLILLVVLGHFIEGYVTSNRSYFFKTLYVFIYTFHMPLFIFISGFFSKNLFKSEKGTLKLMILYFSFQLIGYIQDLLSCGQADFSLFQPRWTLWYLLSLCFWRIFTPYVEKIKFNLIISFLIALLAGCSNEFKNYLSLSRTIVFFPYFLLGYYCSKERIKRITSLISFKSATAILAAAYTINYIFVCKMNFDIHSLYGHTSYEDLHYSITQGIEIRTLLYIIGIVISLLVLNIINGKKNILTTLGKNSLYIYLCHIYIIKALYYVLGKFHFLFT